MVQKTKTASKAVEDTQEEVPTQVNEQSAKVSEETCCLLSEIDSILEEAATVEEIVEPEWDAASAPQPDWERDYKARWEDLIDAGQYTAGYALMDEFDARKKEWYEERGLSYDEEEHTVNRRLSRRARDRCVC